MQPDISVVIVSYNVRELLRHCLHTILDQEVRVEIIVVDNASADNTSEMIRQEFPQVQLLENKGNAGFSEGNNQGIRQAKGKYVLLLNPDTVLPPGSLRSLLGLAEKEGRDFLIGPKLLNEDGSLQKSAWREPGLLSVVLETFFLNKIWDPLSYPDAMFQRRFYPDSLSGAAILADAAALLPLDPELFWVEDVDFCKRHRGIGWKIIYDPSVSIYHLCGKSSARDLRLPIANQLISRIKYLRKHEGRLQAALADFFVLVHCIIRLAILLPLSLISGRSGAASLKRKAYWFAIGKWYRYIIKGDRGIL